MDTNHTERNRCIMAVGFCVCAALTVIIAFIVHGTSLSLVAQRVLIWIPILPMWLFVDSLLHRSENFIPMNPLIEYGLFIGISFLFIMSPALPPLVSLLWLVPLAYGYYHKKNRYE
jgi:hypothetical protein